jgi:hypothetical protein
LQACTLSLEALGEYTMAGVSTIGQYKLREVLGAGTFGKVIRKSHFQLRPAPSAGCVCGERVFVGGCDILCKNGFLTAAEEPVEMESMPQSGAACMLVLGSNHASRNDVVPSSVYYSDAKPRRAVQKELSLGHSQPATLCLFGWCSRPSTTQHHPLPDANDVVSQCLPVSPLEA